MTAIKKESLLNTSEIGVIAKDGIITLSGIVESYTKKLKAKDIVEDVPGVKIVLNGIDLNFDSPEKKTDKEITTEVLSYFKWNWGGTYNGVKAKVENGLVTLDGNLQWNFLKDAMEESVKRLVGIKDISNNVTIDSESKNEIENKEIILITPLLLAS
jgi:osmotically-inducible protein OsmY